MREAINPSCQSVGPGKCLAFSSYVGFPRLKVWFVLGGKRVVRRYMTPGEGDGGTAVSSTF